MLYCDILLIAIGLVYLIKPDVFMRGFWKRTALSQQVLTPNQNKNYMRVLGVLLIVGHLPHRRTATLKRFDSVCNALRAIWLNALQSPFRGFKIGKPVQSHSPKI